MKNIKIFVLNDDRCSSSNFCNKHGFSLYIQTEKSNFLFDVGQDDSFIKNANLLGLNLKNVDWLVLSHGHYDHTDGLKFLNKKINLICHPNSLVWRKSNRTSKYNGIPFNKDELQKHFNVVFSKKFKQLDDQTYFLGEILRKTNFECKTFPSTYKNGKVDTAKDDTGIAIKTDKGLIVISGCGHSGICNTIEQAKAITKESKIYAVLGGFHLKEIDEQVDKTIEYFLANKIQKLYLGHCTSDEVCNYILNKTEGIIDTKILSTGQIIKL